MIVIDTSALMAIFLDEPDTQAYAESIMNHSPRLLSAASYVEAGIVLSGRLGKRRELLDQWLRKHSVIVKALTLPQSELAIDAFHRYGKGRHPANLNFGDCFAYALAKEMKAPLLFKGDDFAKTDILRAL